MSWRQPFKWERCVLWCITKKTCSFNKGKLSEWKKSEWILISLPDPATTALWPRAKHSNIQHLSVKLITNTMAGGTFISQTSIFYPIAQGKKNSFYNNSCIPWFLEGWLYWGRAMYFSFPFLTMTTARCPKEDIKMQKSARENFLPNSRLSQLTDCTKHKYLYSLKQRSGSG